MVPMGPERWGTQSEEWVIHLNYPPDDPRAALRRGGRADARHALGIADLPMEDPHDHALVARGGGGVDVPCRPRVPASGDAAHRHPPTGGLGLTSADPRRAQPVLEARARPRRHAPPALLDTYDPERRPVDRAQRPALGRERGQPLRTSRRALGVARENTPERELAQLRRLWSGRPEDAGHRVGRARAIASQSMEFNEHNVEYGYRYESAAVVPDGSPAPRRRRRSASISRPRARARRCRTRGSSEDGNRVPLRTWSRRAGSC